MASEDGSQLQAGTGEMGVAAAGVKLEFLCPSPGHQLSREGPAGNVCRVKRCGEMSTAKGQGTKGRELLG